MTSRRTFIGTLGALAALGALTACGKEPETIVVTPAASPPPPTATPQAVAPPAPAAEPPAQPTAVMAASPTTAPVAASPTTAPPRPTATVSPAPVGRPQYGQDAQHTGRSAHAGPRAVKLLRSFDTTHPGVDTPEPGWTNSDIQSSFAVGPDGTMYVGNYSGNMHALRDPGKGDKLELAWRFHPRGGSPWHHTPALGRDGTLYTVFSVGGNSPDAMGTLYALRSPSGGIDAQVLWSLDMGPGRTSSSPTLGPDGTLYVVNQRGRLIAVTSEGQLRWSVQTGPAVKANPTLGYDGTVYVSSMDGKLYAVEPKGTEASVKWAFDFGQHLGPTPLRIDKTPPAGGDAKGSGASAAVGPDGTIYVGANNSNFYAVTPDGTLKWLYEAEREVAGIWSAPALAPDAKTVYFGANKGGVYAVNTDDGKLKWRAFVYGSIYNSPTLDSQGTLYTGSNVGHVFGLDAANGKTFFDYDAGAPVWTAPAIRPDGTLVVGDRKGRVLLLGQS
ncbi:MAG TPA: PQQ-binding-like beta-propeller repeat protein [Chloroflexota bacterium]|jgi:outer membrane protein assembly factor BamB